MNRSGHKASLKVWGSPEDSQVVIYIDKQAYDAIHRHGVANPQREIVGILLGNVSEDSTGKYRVDIIGIAKSESAPGNQTQVQFTNEVWLQLVESAQRDYPNQKVVGWYHTHPGFGAFMSDDDVNSHRLAFSHPWHVAAVCDPIKKELCFFGWDGSEIKAIKGFYTYKATANEPEPLPRPERLSPAQSKMPAFLIPVLVLFIALFTIIGLAFTVWLPAEQKKAEGTITPPTVTALSLSPSYLFFGTATDTIPIQLAFTGSENPYWLIASKPDWIKLDKESGFGNAIINVTAERGALSPGDHMDKIILSYDGEKSTEEVPTFITVVAATKSVPAGASFRIISVKDSSDDGKITRDGEEILVQVQNTGQSAGKAEVSINPSEVFTILELPEAQELKPDEKFNFIFRLKPKNMRSGLNENVVFKVKNLTSNTDEYDEESERFFVP